MGGLRGGGSRGTQEVGVQTGTSREWFIWLWLVLPRAFFLAELVSPVLSCAAILATLCLPSTSLHVATNQHMQHCTLLQTNICNTARCYKPTYATLQTNICNTATCNTTQHNTATCNTTQHCHMQHNTAIGVCSPVVV